MRKFAFFLLLLLSVSLVACSSNDEEKKEKKQDNESVSVDKGLMNVEVTLPATFFEGEDIDQLIADAKKEGVKEVKKNSDGSLTYKMSKSDHKKMMKEMEADLEKTIKDMETSDEFVSIEQVKYNKDFKEITVIVDQEKFENSMDGFGLLGLSFQTMLYQLFNGADAEDYQVTFKLQNKETSEVFDTIVYPDALDETEK